MSRYTYNATLVSETLDELAIAHQSLEYTADETLKGIKMIDSATGAELLNIDFSVIVNYEPTIVSYLDSLSTEISSKAKEIEEYEQSPWYKKVFSTVGMSTLKVIEGLCGFAENLGDGVVSIAGAVGGIFNSDFRDACAEYVKADQTSDSFSKAYTEGWLKDVNKYSIYSHESTAANIFKGIGTAAGYIGISLLTGGSNLAVEIGTEASIAAVTGIGQGTQTGLLEGKTFNQAFGEGLKNGVVAAAGEVVTGLAINKIMKIKEVQELIGEAATAVSNTKNKVKSIFTKTANKLVKSSDEVGSVIAKSATSVDNVVKISDDMVDVLDANGNVISSGGKNITDVVEVGDSAAAVINKTDDIDNIEIGKPTVDSSEYRLTKDQIIQDDLARKVVPDDGTYSLKQDQIIQDELARKVVPDDGTYGLKQDQIIQDELARKVVPDDGTYSLKQDQIIQDNLVRTRDEITNIGDNAAALKQPNEVNLKVMDNLDEGAPNINDYGNIGVYGQTAEDTMSYQQALHNVRTAEQGSEAWQEGVAKLSNTYGNGSGGKSLNTGGLNSFDSAEQAAAYYGKQMVAGNSSNANAYLEQLAEISGVGDDFNDFIADEALRYAQDKAAYETSKQLGGNLSAISGNLSGTLSDGLESLTKNMSQINPGSVTYVGSSAAAAMNSIDDITSSAVKNLDTASDIGKKATASTRKGVDETIESLSKTIDGSDIDVKYKLTKDIDTPIEHSSISSLEGGFKAVDDLPTTSTLDEIIPSTQKVADAVEEVGTHTDEVADAVGEVGTHADEAADVAEEVGTHTDEAADVVEEVGTHTDEAADVAEEVGTHTDEVTDGVEEVGTHTDEVTDGVEAATTHVDEVAEVAETTVSQSDEVLAARKELEVELENINSQRQAASETLESLQKRSDDIKTQIASKKSQIQAITDQFNKDMARYQQSRTSMKNLIDELAPNGVISHSSDIVDVNNDLAAAIIDYLDQGTRIQQTGLGKLDPTQLNKQLSSWRYMNEVEIKWTRKWGGSYQSAFDDLAKEYDQIVKTIREYTETISESCPTINQMAKLTRETVDLSSQQFSLERQIARATSKVESLSQTADDIISQMDNLSVKTTNIVGKHTDEVADAVGEVTTHADETAAVAEEVGTHADEAADVAEEVGTHADEAADVAEEVGTHADEAADVAEEVGTHADEAADVAEEVGTHADEAADVAEEVGTHADEAADVAEEVGTHTDEAADVAEEVGTHTDEAADVAEVAETTVSQSDEVLAARKELEVELENINSQRQAASETLESLQKRSDDIKTQIASKKSQRQALTEQYNQNFERYNSSKSDVSNLIDELAPNGIQPSKPGVIRANNSLAQAITDYYDQGTNLMKRGVGKLDPTELNKQLQYWYEAHSVDIANASSIARSSGRYYDVRRALNELTDEYNQMLKTLTDYTESIRDAAPVTRQMAKLSDDINNLYGEKFTFDRQIKQTTMQLDNLGKNADDIISQMDNLSVKTTNIVGKHTDEVADAVGEVTTHADEAADVAEEVGTHADEVTDVAEEVGTHTDEVTDVAEEVGTHTDEVTDVAEEAGTHTDEATDAVGKVTTHADEAADGVKSLETSSGANTSSFDSGLEDVTGTKAADLKVADDVEVVDISTPVDSSTSHFDEILASAEESTSKVFGHSNFDEIVEPVKYGDEVSQSLFGENPGKRFEDLSRRKSSDISRLDRLQRDNYYYQEGLHSMKNKFNQVFDGQLSYEELDSWIYKMRGEAENFFGQYRSACTNVVNSGSNNFSTRLIRGTASADDVLDLRKVQLLDDYELDQQYRIAKQRLEYKSEEMLADAMRYGRGDYSDTMRYISHQRDIIDTNYQRLKRFSHELSDMQDNMVRTYRNTVEEVRAIDTDLVKTYKARQYEQLTAIKSTPAKTYTTFEQYAKTMNLDGIVNPNGSGIIKLGDVEIKATPDMLKRISSELGPEGLARVKKGVITVNDVQDIQTGIIESIRKSAGELEVTLPNRPNYIQTLDKSFTRPAYGIDELNEVNKYLADISHQFD